MKMMAKIFLVLALSWMVMQCQACETDRCPVATELIYLGCPTIHEVESLECVRDDHEPPEELPACTLYHGHGEWVCNGKRVITDEYCTTCGDDDYPLFDELDECGTYAIVDQPDEVGADQ